MPARMPYFLGMSLFEERPVVAIDIPLKFKTVQGVVRFTISDHVWFYDLPVTRAGMALAEWCERKGYKALCYWDLHEECGDNHEQWPVWLA